MFEEYLLFLDWFVDVNYYEVKVFCNYLSEKMGDFICLLIENEW